MPCTFLPPGLGVHIRERRLDQAVLSAFWRCSCMGSKYEMAATMEIVLERGSLTRESMHHRLILSYFARPDTDGPRIDNWRVLQ